MSAVQGGRQKRSDLFDTLSDAINEKTEGVLGEYDLNELTDRLIGIFKRKINTDVFGEKE